MHRNTRLGTVLLLCLAGLVAAGIEPNIIKTERFGGAVA